MSTTPFKQYDEATDTLDLLYNYNPEETKSLTEAANGNIQIDLNLLRRIALWKLDRVLDVPDKTIQQLQTIAKKDDLRVDSAETRSLIGELIDCPGIGLPMASTILKFLRPDVFPIIDVRACRALYGKKVYFNQRSDDATSSCISVTRPKFVASATISSDPYVRSTSNFINSTRIAMEPYEVIAQGGQSAR